MYSIAACASRGNEDHMAGYFPLVMGKAPLLWLDNLPAECITSKATVTHGYPWVPVDQAHGRPRQVGPAYQKTRRPVSGPNQPSWRPTRPPEDLPEDSSDDLIHQNDFGIQDKTTVNFAQKKIDRIWQEL
jgi:hypothetical protein